MNEVNSTPPQRRRRSRKKTSNIKKYFEWAMWAITIAFLIITFIMLIMEATKKDDSAPGKKKGSTGNYNCIVPFT